MSDAAHAAEMAIILARAERRVGELLLRMRHHAAHDRHGNEEIVAGLFREVLEQIGLACCLRAMLGDEPPHPTPPHPTPG